MTEEFDYNKWLHDLPYWLDGNRNDDGTLTLSKKVADQVTQTLRAATEWLVPHQSFSMKMFRWEGRQCFAINGRYFEFDDKHEIVDGVISKLIDERYSILDKKGKQTDKDRQKLAEIDERLDGIPTADNPEDRDAMDTIRRAAKALKSTKARGDDGR